MVIAIVCSMALLAGPGPVEPAPHQQIPSLHMMQHLENRGVPNLHVSGFDGGRSLTRTVYGFLPYWGNDTWLRYDLISILACFCVDMDASGNISSYNGFPGIFSDAIDGINAAGGVPVVTVVNFSSSSIHSILTSHSAEAIDNIIELVDQNPVDGVSIDFENVSGSDRDSLTAFMEELRYQMNLQLPGSHLSICTPAVDWSGAFDYEALVQCTDALFMMCYAFHGSWSSVAGPCCPLTGWGASPESSTNMVWCLGDYAKYAPEGHHRIVVGLPYYGHQWETQGGSSHSQVTGDCSTLIYTTLADRAAAYGRLWDQESLTPWYAYYSGGWNQGWYDDEESLKLKYDLIRASDLQGAGIWALGYDGSREELWDCIEESFCGPEWSDSVTDNLESRFSVHGPEQYWRNVTEGGEFYGYFYTYSISQGPDVNWAEWTFQLPDSSMAWMLDAWLPQGGTAQVEYRVQHAGGTDTVTVDQSLHQDEWVCLGGPWTGSEGLEVLLGDCTGETGDKIVADCIRFRPPTGIESDPDAQVSGAMTLASGNPASTFIIEIPADDSGGMITVLDVTGRAVFSADGCGSASNHFTWPVCQDYPSGLYTIIYRGAREYRSLRVVLLGE